MILKVFLIPSVHALNEYWNFNTGDMISEMFLHSFAPSHTKGIFFFTIHK